MAKVRKYSVSLPWFASVIIEVEAESKEEALDVAIQNACPSVCCHCSERIEICEMDTETEPEVLELEAKGDK